MQKLYQILGVSEDASIEEIESSYKALKEQYSKERFLEGEAGNEGARKLTLLENAYAEVMAVRKNEETTSYADIESAIRKGDISLAQEKLDLYSTRDAEWHYLQSVVFYKKNWLNESKKQLEIAMSMDTANKKYADAYTRMNERIAFNEKQFQSGNANMNEEQTERPEPQMGGNGTMNCCSSCATWCCMNAALNLCLNMCCHC